MAYLLGGKVQTSEVREYGKTDVHFNQDAALFKKVDKNSVCWMSHTDYIAEPPVGFRSVATSGACPVAAMENSEKHLYATQFHPEVNHTVQGMDMLRSFLFDVCGCKGDWKMSSYVNDAIERIRAKAVSYTHLGTAHQ